VTQQIKAPKSKERQAIPRSTKTSIHEIPKSIFTFPKDTAWEFTVSTTPCRDRGIARGIRSHAGVKNRNVLLGRTEFFLKKRPTEPFRRYCTALKRWANQKKKIKSIALPRLSRRSGHTGWVTSKKI